MRRSVRSVKLKNLMPVKRQGGKVDWYYRRKGHPLVRLPDLPHDHPEFLTAYAEAMKSAPPWAKPKSGSIAALTGAALQSQRYLALSKVYKTTLRRHLDKITEKAGTAPGPELLSAGRPVGAMAIFDHMMPCADFSYNLCIESIET